MTDRLIFLAGLVVAPCLAVLLGTVGVVVLSALLAILPSLGDRDRYGECRGAAPELLHACMNCV